MTLRGLFSSISSKEWKAVAAAAAVAVLLTAVPPLYGLYLARARGLVWAGLQYLSPGDFNVYLSYIEQAKQGRLLFENLYTTEKLFPVLNVFWLLAGWLARLFHLSPLAAFHVIRTLLIPPLAVSAYALTAFFFQESRRRLTAFGLFMFGSGLGLYLSPLFASSQPVGGSYQWPIDMWVAESNTFLTMLYSPHFIASLTLIILAVLLLLLAVDSGSWRLAAGAGLAALLLFEFHPFHAPTLYAVPFVWISWLTVRRRAGLRQWLAYCLFAAVSLPAVAYHYYLTHYDAAAAALLRANLTITPKIWHVLIGLGAVGLLWLPGYLLLRRREPARADRWDLLAIWVVVQGILIYSPLTFQRRLLEGIEFPLALLTVPVIFWAGQRFWRWIGSDRTYGYALCTVAAVIVFLPSTVSAMVRSLDAYSSNKPPIFFYSRDEFAAMDWLRRSTPLDAVILGSATSGNKIPGLTGRRVYLGHWVNTIDLGRKRREADSFFGGMDDAQRLDFAGRQGISFIYCGPTERAAGGCPADRAAFPVVYSGGEVTIMRVAGSGLN